jgi:PST family polysaccharide transporter
MAGSAVKDVNVYSAVRWSAVAKYGAQAVDFVTSIIVARLVMPEAYGLMSMALVLIGFLSILQSLGFGPAIIQRKTISQALLSTLFIANLVLSLAMVVVVAGAAPLFGWIYRDQRVTWVMLALTVQFVLNSFGLVPNALLTRKMRFGALAAVDIAAALVRLVVAIGLAYRGWEVWALVWSSAISAAAQSLCLWIAAHWRPRLWFRYKHLYTVLGFSGWVTASSVVSYFGRSAGDFIIGTFLGASALGPFSIASRFMFFAREAIADVIMRVFFPLFARTQDDDAKLAAVFLKVTEAICLVSFPFVLGLVAIAPALVDFLLGPKWKAAVPVMYGLSGVAMLYPVLVPTGHLFLAKGKTKLMFIWDVVRISISIGGIAVGCYWGILGVAVAWSLAAIIAAIPTVVNAIGTVTNLSFSQWVATLMPYMALAGTMALAVLILRTILAQDNLTPVADVGIASSSGLFVYCLFLLAIRPAMFRSLVKLVIPVR